MSTKFDSKSRFVGISPQLHAKKETAQSFKKKYAISISDEEIISIFNFHFRFIETEIEKIKLDTKPNKKDEKKLLSEISQVAEKIHKNYLAIAKLTCEKLEPLIEILVGYGYYTIEAVEKAFDEIEQARIDGLKDIDDETDFPRFSADDPGKILQNAIIMNAAGCYEHMTGKQANENFKYTLGITPCSGEFYQFLQDFFKLIIPALKYLSKEAVKLQFSTDEVNPKKIFEGEAWGKCVYNFFSKNEIKKNKEAVGN